MKNYVLGVVGQGFVGNAFREGMKNKFTVETYDKFIADKSTRPTLEALVDNADVLFVSVPTPMRRSGECDLSIVESVLQEIYDCVAVCSSFKRKEVVIRSTTPPGSCAAWHKKFGQKLEVIFNPEFLTEVNAVKDFANQNRVVLGFTGATAVVPGAGEQTATYAIYKHAFPDVPILSLPSAAAELVKYTTNIFLATKVSLANELYQICGALGVDYDQMIEAAKHDDRLGDSHWLVPGPPQVHDATPRFGFGGHCFPKDLNALRFLAEQVGLSPTMLKAVWEKNLEVRQSAARDWEGMTGRAVSDS